MPKEHRVLKTALFAFVTCNCLLAQDTYKLESVSVSANKIDEKIEDVPQSITVIDEEILQEKGIKTLNDVTKEVPNMITSGSNNGVAVSFRGLNTSMFTGSNPVVIYVDGVPYYDRYDFDPSLADVAQVEVLRGPQGTLYGKDAIGAVINIVTKTPSNEWKGNLSAEYGNYNYMRATFNTNGALIDDTLYAGINGIYTADDGWITNNYPDMQRDADKDKERKLSAFVLFKPIEQFSARLTLTDNYSKTNWMDGLAVTDNTILISDIQRDDAKQASFEMPTYEKTKVQSQSLHLVYEFDNTKIESTTTHKVSDLDADYDGDYLSNQGLYDGLRMFGYQDIEMLTQEIKLSGKFDDIKWVFGVYADDEEKDVGPYGQEMLYFGDVYVSDVYGTTLSKTQAAFGQTMIPFAEDFELTLGGRYQKIKKEIDTLMYTRWGSTVYPDFTYHDKKTWNTFLPKAALTYKQNENITTFFSISKGYMPGGFNFYAMSGGSEENSFEPQQSTNYEFGIKVTGDSYRFNSSIFRMDIEDIHIYRTVNGTAWLTDNAKKAHSQGIELDGTYFLGENFELSAALGFIDAKYDDYDTGVANYDGKRIENTPRYTANVGIAYLNEEGLYGRVDLYARGETDFFDGANNQMVRADGAVLSNLRLGYRLDDFDIYTYAKNITDEEYIDTFRSRAGLQIVGFNEPRTFGLGARYTF